MDVSLFFQILHDRHFPDYRKLQYKYGDDFSAFLLALESLFYRSLPLDDGRGKPVVFLEDLVPVEAEAFKLLLQSRNRFYGLKAAEEEIIASSAIESIDYNRDSVRRILKGMAPADEQENRILGLKKGLDFIADPANAITEENLYRLYMTAVGDFLTGEDRLPDGRYYRDDAVYVAGSDVEHIGAAYEKLPGMMRELIAFANEEDGVNDLVKAALIHFHIGFLHPYFDGNGRIARLVHLWFLVQRGYRSALFVPFSALIEKSRKAYYDAFTATEENRAFSGRIDATPFVLYMIENVYRKLGDGEPAPSLLTAYEDAVKRGAVTEKEMRLWQFVLSRYGKGEFSTKQLEKDFGDAAYATIRGFVLKFSELGLLASIQYGIRIKYKIADPD